MVRFSADCGKPNYRWRSHFHLDAFLQWPLWSLTFKRPVGLNFERFTSMKRVALADLMRTGLKRFARSHKESIRWSVLGRSLWPSYRFQLHGPELCPWLKRLIKLIPLEFGIHSSSFILRSTSMPVGSWPTLHARARWSQCCASMKMNEDIISLENRQETDLKTSNKITMKQVPLECDINIAVNGCSGFATSTQKGPFTAMLIHALEALTSLVLFVHCLSL